MSTVTNTQVAVKYRRYVGSLSIDMSADNRTATFGRHIDRHIHRVSADISTDARPICWRIYRATNLGRHIDQYVDRHIGRHSADMSTDTSVDCRSICRPICRPRGAENMHDPIIRHFFTWFIFRVFPSLLLNRKQYVDKSITLLPLEMKWFSPPLAAMLVLQRTKLKLWPRLLLHSHISIDSLIHCVTSPARFW